MARQSLLWMSDDMLELVKGSETATYGGSVSIYRLLKLLYTLTASPSPRNRVTDAEAATASVENLDHNIPFNPGFSVAEDSSTQSGSNNANAGSHLTRRRNSGRQPAPTLPLSKVYAK